MMAGILAMFEFGLSMTGQDAQLLPPIDPYFKPQGLPQRAGDRDFLRLLNNPGFLLAIGKQSSQRLCNCLKCRVKDDQYQGAPGQILAGQAGEDSNLCESSVLTSPHCAAAEKIHQNYSFLDAYDPSMISTVSGDAPSFFASACAMTNKNKNHRVLIQPDPSDPALSYELYSCGNDAVCTFE